MDPSPVPQSKPSPRQGSGANVFAAFISLLIPGAGQFCQGRLLPGLGFFIASALFADYWIETRAVMGLMAFIACSIGSCVNAARWTATR